MTNPMTDPTPHGMFWNISVAAFIQRHGITMTATPVGQNPNIEPDAWADAASHWKCTFKMAAEDRPMGKGQSRRRLTVYFSQGSAHTQPPTAEEVLDCLASDTAGVADGQSFEDWCDDYGYDPDSRRAERTYRAVKAQEAKLRRFLDDDDAFVRLVHFTDRL